MKRPALPCVVLSVDSCIKKDDDDDGNVIDDDTIDDDGDEKEDAPVVLVITINNSNNCVFCPVPTFVLRKMVSMGTTVARSWLCRYPTRCSHTVSCY